MIMLSYQNKYLQQVTTTSQPPKPSSQKFRKLTWKDLIKLDWIWWAGARNITLVRVELMWPINLWRLSILTSSFLIRQVSPSEMVEPVLIVFQKNPHKFMNLKKWLRIKQEIEQQIQRWDHISKQYHKVLRLKLILQVTIYQIFLIWDRLHRMWNCLNLIAKLQLWELTPLTRWYQQQLRIVEYKR